MQQVFSLAWHKLPSQRQQLQAFDCSLCFAHFPWRVSKRRTPAYFAARTCFAFEFVSPYLLGKPNLDDTCRLSHNCKPSLAACVSPISSGASVKGELLPTSPRELALLLSLFRLICLVSRIWMIHTKSQQELFIKK